MKIILGEHLSQMTYTNDFFQASLGKVALSPSGFLSYLETQFGLKHPEVPSYIRKQKYLQALEAVKKGSFYEKSFEVDRIGVTEHLLKMRDQLMLGVWDGQSGEIRKLKELAKVEKHFDDSMGKPDQIHNLIKNMNKLKAPISSLTVMDDPVFQTSLWKKLFNVIIEQGVEVKEFQAEETNSQDGDLKNLKSALKDKNTQKPNGDGSVLCFHDNNARQGASMLSRYLLTKKPEDLSQTVIIVGDRHRTLLSQEFYKVGIPFPGESGQSSLSRPSVQILILALDLIEYPKKLASALSLLSHSYFPFSKWVKRYLLNSLNDHPAVGGQEWENALLKIREKLKEEKVEQETIDKRIQAVEQWFSTHIKVPVDHIPKAEYLRVCDHVSSWAQTRVGESEALKQTIQLCTDLKRFLQDWPQEEVNPNEFRKLIREIIGSGTYHQDVEPRGNGPVILRSLDELLHPAKEVIWWDANQSAQQNSEETLFLKAEREALKKDGIHIPEPQETSALKAKKWQHPIFYAQEKLCFFTFERTENGEQDYPHPIFDQVFNPEERELWFSKLRVQPGEVENKLTTDFLKQVGAKKVNNQPEKEPHALYNWKLPGVVVPFKKQESASSLEMLLGCNLAYALKYHSNLKTVSLPSIKDEARLVGLLNHKVMEEIFQPGAPPQEEALPARIEGELNRYIPEMLPELDLPDNQLKKRAVFNKLEQSALVYTRFLHANGLHIEDAEVEKIKKFNKGIELKGYVDQVLSKDGKVVAILDFKKKLWGLFGEKMEKGTAIQPVIYSWFYENGTWPDMGYFGIDKAQHIVAGKYVENADRVIDAQPPHEVLENLKGWLKEEETHLTKGMLVAKGLVDQKELKKQSGYFSPPCKFCNFSALCGRKWGVFDE